MLNASAKPHGKIAVILKGYPRLSETFIAQELRGLEKAGFALRLISMRHPTDTKSHPVHDEIEAPVRYLPEYLHDEPVRVFRAWWQQRRRPSYKATFGQFWQDLKRDVTRNRIRRFGQALVLANELEDDVTHIHAHFLHTPASVAHYTSLLTGLAFTCSAHAKDIWTSTDEDLTVKLRQAKWVVTCTKNGWRHLQSLSPRPETVHLSYHGLDLSRFGPAERKPASRDGSDPHDPVRLITVCRAVEKKGLDTLMAALAKLPKDCDWTWQHIGAGGLVSRLQAQAGELGIADRLEWRGALAQTEVLKTYRQADLFVLPCRVAADGDRDGLPNVIVEAQSQAVPVVSTNVSGVPELIEDGKNGLLVDQNDAEALAAALERLIKNPLERAEMGKTGEKRVRAHFDHVTSISDLTNLFASVGVAPSPKVAA